MRRSRDLRLSNAGPAAVFAAALAVPVALLVAFGAREADDLYITHMVAVGATMLIAGAAAFLLTRAGTKRGDVRAVTVGTAFAAMAALLLVHALATPEVFLDEEDNGLLAFAGGATLPVGAAILCLAAHPRLRGQEGLGLLRRVQVIRRHPVWGDELAGALGFPPAVRRLVRSHHERLDHNGYPDGTAQLDLDVRILTVCDIYDALVSERVYRGAMASDEAFAILDAERGTAFDPACVGALRTLLGIAGRAAA